MERLLSHEQVPDIFRNELTLWSARDRADASAYIHALNEADRLHGAFVASVREVRKAHKAGDTGYVVSDKRAAGNSAEYAWKNAVAAAKEREATLSSFLRDALKSADIGRAAPRRALQERLTQLENDIRRTAEAASSVERVEPEMHVPNPDVMRPERPHTADALLAAVASPDLCAVELPVLALPAHDVRSIREPDVGPPPSRQSLMTRWRASPMFRRAMGALTFLGIFGKAYEASADVISAQAQQEERIVDAVHTLRYNSLVERGAEVTGFSLSLPTDETSMVFSDGTEERFGDIVDTFNTKITTALQEKGAPLWVFEDACRASSADEPLVLDVFRCDALYGDQYPFLSDQGREVLGVVYNMSPLEMRAHADVLHEGVFHKGGIRVPGAFARVIPHDVDSVPSSLHGVRDELYHGYGDAVSEATRFIFLHVDFSKFSSSEQKNAVKILGKFGQEYVEFHNESLVVLQALRGMNQELVHDQLTMGLKGRPSEIAQLWEAAHELELSIHAVAALERDAQGPVHTWERTMRMGVQTTLQEIFSAGLLGNDAPFFQEQLSVLGSATLR